MRQDQWSNTVTIDGKPMGVWDTLAGGQLEASETKYRPGGMAPQISLGGPTTVGNLTLGRLLSPEDWGFLRGLVTQDRVGKATCSVTRQPLDADGNPFGDPLNYRGVLLSATPGDTDSNATAAQVWQIVVSTDSGVA